MTNIKITIILLALALISCVGQTKSDKGTKNVDNVAVKSTPSPLVQPSFAPPVIPDSLVDNSAKIAFMADHFWDSFDFSDSLLVANSELTSRAFAAYASVLINSEKEDFDSSVNDLLARAFSSDTHAFNRFTELFEEFFHNPISPYMNEEIYIPALRYVVDNDSISDEDKLRPKMHLEMALKNRVGNRATNFTYKLKNGTKGKMHNIAAEYIIIYFNNPDCHDCERVKGLFENSETIADLNSEGRLKVLSVYPDEDEELWQKATYPDFMIDACDVDQTISNKQLYDLKAIPTLYLLDKNKKVIFKDAPFEAIEAYLETNYKPKK